MRKFQILNIYAPIMVIALLLRGAVACFNRQANDDHLLIIHSLMQFKDLPVNGCWECYHPRLFHHVCALFLNLFHIHRTEHQIIFCQWLNVIAGMVTLEWIRRTLCSMQFETNVTCLVFALIAWNPDFAGINTQVTNDSFVICFTTGAFYSLWQYVDNVKPVTSHLIRICIFTALATITKGSGLIVWAVDALSMLIYAYTQRHREARSASVNGSSSSSSSSSGSSTGSSSISGSGSVGISGSGSGSGRVLIHLLVLIIATFICCTSLGPYLNNARVFGSAFATNMPKNPPPKFFTKEIVGRAGVTSIANAYFTFRISNLITYPYDTQGTDWFPAHRTSLWSQLFGRYHFAQFSAWPPSWATNSAAILNLGRAIFILAIPATLIFIWGILICFRKLSFKSTWLFLVIFTFYLLMILKLTYDNRCFCAMKAIYVEPALIAGAVIAAHGYESVGKKSSGFGAISKKFGWILASCYALDMVALLSQLTFLIH